MSTAYFRDFQCEELHVSVRPTIHEMAELAAAAAAEHLQQAIAQKGGAAAILATGNSQLAFLDVLVAGQGTKWDVDWSKVTLFHMDEYLGLPATHPASFRLYMRERVEKKLRPKVFHYVEGDVQEPLNECERYTRLLQAQPIDLCCLGVGENGHLAFNDPPVADFADKRLVKIVRLEESCRLQQVGEGHFPNLNAVPQYAITLTIPALCKVGRMLAIVPEERKARAVLETLTKPISVDHPGTFLRRQKHCTLYLEADSARLISEKL